MIEVETEEVVVKNVVSPNALPLESKQNLTSKEVPTSKTQHLLRIDDQQVEDVKFVEKSKYFSVTLFYRIYINYLIHSLMNLTL